MDNDNLEITEDLNDGIYKVTARGRIDSNNANILLERLENAMNNGNKNIILNMYHIDYLSSIGIRVILKIYKQAMESGSKFKIEHPSAIVKNVLGMVALKELLIVN